MTSVMMILLVQIWYTTQEENDGNIIISGDEENTDNIMEHFIGTTIKQTVILTFKRIINTVKRCEYVMNNDSIWDYFVEKILAELGNSDSNLFTCNSA